MRSAPEGRGGRVVDRRAARDVAGLAASRSHESEAEANRDLLLERGRELAECIAAVENARAGLGGTVVLEGPAGIGKTELLRAVRAHASATGMAVLTARGLEVEREVAFGGVRQLLEPVLRAAAAEETARLFSGAASPAARLFERTYAAVPQVDAAFATLNALYWVLAGLADARPLVAVVDDAHWLDPPSQRLLDFLAPRIEELPVAAVVATRPPHGADEQKILARLIADPGSRIVRPAPLSATAVTELVRARIGVQPDRAFVEACADATGGNPLYLSELLRELQQHGVRGRREEAALVAEVGPPSVLLALRFRGATSTDEMAIARAVAVLGDGARLDEAAALAGVDVETAAGVADTLVRESVFAAAPGLAFAHPIVRSAVYADIGPKERARAHSRAAQLLHAAGTPIERVAAHLMRTEPARDHQIVKLLRAAAAAVRAQGAPDIAGDYLRRALAEPPDHAVRAEVLLELGRAEASVANPDSVAHLNEAYALAPDVRTRTDAALLSAVSFFSFGSAGEAIARLAAVAEELAHEDADRALEVEAQLVALAMYDPASAALHLARLDRFDESPAADSTGRRMMLCQLAFARLWRSEDGRRAAELAQRALADGLLLAERGTDSPELGWAGAAITLTYADCLEPAARVLDAAIAQARERGSRFGFALASCLRSELAYRQGALHDAEAEARASLSMMPPEGQLIRAASVSLLIRVLIERGALHEAEAAFEAARVNQLPLQLPFSPLSSRGRIRLAGGDLEGGLADLHQVGRNSETVGLRNPLLVPWRGDAALAHRERGELDAAWGLAEEELAAARAWGTPGAIGAAQRLVGLLSSGDDAIAMLHEAVDALAKSPARLEHARALVDLGAALLRAKRRADAREPLARGLDLAERSGATVLGRRAREELAAIGARPRRAQLTGIDALTASERRVAEMAARGLGNTEIAQTLFVTRKTVEKHLSNAYTKLGVKSRSELPEHFPK